MTETELMARGLTHLIWRNGVVEELHAEGYAGDVEPWMLDVLDDRENSLEERARRLLEGE